MDSIRSLVKNHVQGVTEGFEVKLTLIGVGYRANVQGNKLDLQLGIFAPYMRSKFPRRFKWRSIKGPRSASKARIREKWVNLQQPFARMKPPEPYKGKGIRYENEYVRKKEGKAAKGKA